MDEQEKQLSYTPETQSGSADNTGKRNARRRNRRKRGSRQGGEPQTIEAQASTTETEEERPRTGNAAKPKRRNAPKRVALLDDDQPSEVVRYNAPTIAPLQPMRLREIDPSDMSEPIVGCPMLTRTRLGIPFRGGQRVPRCSVGWSIHDEDEVLLCMHTATAAECWKDNPAQLEVLVERLRPIIEAELAPEQETHS